MLDSVSIVPLCLVPLAVIFAGENRLTNILGLLGGILAVYFTGGLALLFGLDLLMDQVRTPIARWWTDPNTVELIVQLLIGVVMLWYAGRFRENGTSKTENRVIGAITPGRAFVLGAGLVVVSFPGALPYFGALDQILRYDLTLVENVAAILFYDLIFISPLIALVFVRVVFPAYSEKFFGGISSVFDKYGSRGMVYVVLLLGLVLVADAIGWFFGVPLIPVD